MTNLFLTLVFICISSVLNGANFASAENGISVHQYSVFNNDLQNSQGTLDKIEDVSSYQDSDDTSKELLVEKPGNVASLHHQSDSETSYESHNKYLEAKGIIDKRDEKSVKKSVKKNVKSTNNVEDQCPENMQDDDQAVNDELEKEYVNQIKEKNVRDFEEDDDDEDKSEETDNEIEESSQNTNDEDNDEDENTDRQLSDKSRVSSGKRQKENANWLVLQPLNDSLTVVGHKSLVKSDDRDKRRKKKGVRHELDEEKYKLKDLTDMNTMKKKLSEDDMYKRILLNLDNDSEEEKEFKKWEKFKDNNNKINSDGSKRKKQKKKGKYAYLNNKDLNHGVNHGLISDGDSIYGRAFGKAKLKSPYFVDYTELRHRKGNQDHVNYNAKKKHKKPLRKFKDNFQDIINNKISKCKDSSTGDSKKQNSLWSVENKDDENTANKKKAHGNSVNNKHGKMKHFLESDSKFQSDNNVVQNSNNDRTGSPVQVYRVDVKNRKIIPVFDGDTSSDKRREAHNSEEDNNYIATPYNISIEFLENPTAKDMRKRSLKYYNEEFPPLPSPSMYEKFQGNNVKNARMFRNDPPLQDKNSILREKIISDIYNALKANNPELIDTDQEVKNSELFNTDDVDLNDFLKKGNEAESLYDSRRGKDMYNGRSYDNNVYHALKEGGLTVSENNQYTENNNDGRDNDVKRNANNKHLLNELTKMIQKKAAKIVTSTSTEVYSTRTHKTSTESTESTTCMELFKEFTGESNNMVANDEKLSTDDQWVTIPSVCMTSKAGKAKSGKLKTTQAVKQSTRITGTSREPTTTQKIDQGKFADMLNGKLADRFFEEISKKVNRSKKMSREIGLCNEKYKLDATRRCIENGPEELLPLSTLKNIMYKIKENKPESSFLCNAVPSELNSFINFLIANTKQKAKECVAIKKQSNFLFKPSDANKYDSSLNKEYDFNLIPEKQLNLQKSKLNRKTGKSDDYETEEKENVDEVLVNKVLGNKSSKMKSTTKGKLESEFVDDILQDGSNRLIRSDVERSNPADSAQHNDYDYNNMNQYNSQSENYGNRELERFYYGNSDTNSETTFKDKISNENENNNFNDDNDNHERTDSHNNNNSNNGGGPLKHLLSSSIFNTISDKIFKNKPAVKEEDASKYAKAKRQRMSDSMKMKMHKLLYEDGVPEDDEYYDDDGDDARVKKDTENSNTYEGDDDYDYDGYDLSFSDENKIADESNLEDAFVVRTPVEEYNSYYE